MKTIIKRSMFTLNDKNEEDSIETFCFQELISVKIVKQIYQLCKTQEFFKKGFGSTLSTNGYKDDFQRIKTRTLNSKTR